MDRRYRDRGQNPVERAMRPGVLLMALLIGFAIIFFLTPSTDAPLAVTDGSEVELTTAGNDEDYDEDGLDEELADDDPVESKPVDDDGVDEGTADEDPADNSEGSGEAGEGYDDPEPRPGDDEPAEDTDPGPGDDEVAEDEADDEEDLEDEGRHRECIYVRAINNFHVIDEKHLTVSTSPRRLYLVTLWNRCHDLKWSHTIAIKAYGSWTCSHSRDYVITKENRCIIDNIERVSSIEEAEEIVAERTGDAD